MRKYGQDKIPGHKTMVFGLRKPAVIGLSVITILLGGSNLSGQVASGERRVGQGAPDNSRMRPQVKSVRFKNGRISMAGNLFLPGDFEESRQYAAIICVHPGGGVKEQTAGLYAQKLAERGFITLAFDASHQGESGGEPRFLEDPSARVEDIRSGVDYLASLAFVGHDRVGALGVCAGGGYAINAAMTERRIRAVAAVSAVDIGTTFRKGWDGNAPVSEQLKALNAVAKQRTAESNGAKPMYVNYVPEVPDESTPRDLREAHDYYRAPRGQHPNSTNKLWFNSLDKVLAFTAFDQIDNLLTQPLLLIAGSEAGSLWQSKDVYRLAKGPKELFIAKGATHMALYDIHEFVGQAVDRLSSFYKSSLVPSNFRP